MSTTPPREPDQRTAADAAVLRFAGPGDAPGLAAFLQRQLRWDKAAVVRLRADARVLAAFTRPARFEVLAVRPGRLAPLAEPGGAAVEPQPAQGPLDGGLDATVSAGQLLDGIDESAGAVTVPPSVTGPPWAGVLPPRGAWGRVLEVEEEALRAAAGEVIGEFRARTERLGPAERTREALDGLAEEIWERRYPGTDLPLRAVHAAWALGFLRGGESAAVLGSGPWLRLRTAHGSIVVRGPGARPALGLTPL